MQFDIKAIITNKRKSKNCFCNGYRPAFDIHKQYSTTGEICFESKDKLEFNESTIAFIRFLTPEVYPKSVWVGKRIAFKEGTEITGDALVLEVYNEILLSHNEKEAPLMMFNK